MERGKTNVPSSAKEEGADIREGDGKSRSALMTQYITRSAAVLLLAFVLIAIVVINTPNTVLRYVFFPVVLTIGVVGGAIAVCQNLMRWVHEPLVSLEKGK